jgi:hypothetical protein
MTNNNSMSASCTAEHLLQHPDFREAAIATSVVVDKARMALETQQEGEEVELEGRLGQLGPRGFDSDVGEAFTAIVQMLESYPRWSRVVDWCDSEDVFFTTNVYGHVQEVRSRITYGDAGLSVNNIIKKRLHTVDLRLRSTDPGCCALETEQELTTRLDARVSSAVERLVPLEALPPSVRPSRVRIKRQKSFYLACISVPKEAFRFDCSFVWSGCTKREAETNLAEGTNMIREVEVECLLPQDYLRRCQGDSTYLALSIILKLADFVSLLNPTTTVTFVPAR